MRGENRSFERKWGEGDCRRPWQTHNLPPFPRPGGNSTICTGQCRLVLHTARDIPLRFLHPTSRSTSHCQYWRYPAEDIHRQPRVSVGTGVHGTRQQANSPTTHAAARERSSLRVKMHTGFAKLCPSSRAYIPLGWSLRLEAERLEV